jgi:Ca-activated chloride channel family protein
MDLVFNHPNMLWFLLAIPLLFFFHFFALKYVKARGMKFANFEALKRVTGENILTTNTFLLIFRLLTVTLIVFGVAGTVLWYKGMSNENDFVIAIDNSASMAAGDFDPNRLGAAKEEAKYFINALDSDARIGLVTFSGIATVKQLLVRNQAILLDDIDKITIDPAGSTDLGGAIITSTNLLLASQKGRTILLITDGSATTGVYLADSLARSIEYAKEKHVIVHAIGIGSNIGPIGYLPEYYNISSVFNEENLILISNSTGGMYVNAKNNLALRQAYAKVNSASNEAYLSVDLTYYLILAALILLFVEWGLINTRFRRIP